MGQLYGLVGLGVMGRSLALNIARNGFSLAVWNREPEFVRDFIDRAVTDEPVVGCTELEQFLNALDRPRRIILLIKAGAPVDELVERMAPLLDAGDLIVDAGNSHPDDTARRSDALAARGLRFVGMGVSGGEEGALRGPSLMPGGPADAYAEFAPMLEAIAAKVADGPCVTHVGPGAAGHFVKMVHNGIEYGDMQLIAETYDVMRGVLGMTPTDAGAVFATWNGGDLESYLIEITADILGQTDAATGGPVVDIVLDRAGQKGTGRWTAESALRYGVPIPTIQAAVDARGMSADLDRRRVASTQLRGPTATGSPDRDAVLAQLERALYASKISSYAQGLDLLRAAGREHDWPLDFVEIARIWKGGCIIRARFLERIQDAYRAEPELAHLLLAPSIREVVHAAQDAWRSVVGLAVAHGVAVPAMGASLAYFDSIRRERLPQSLTQAQRDYFGAHTFERRDRPEGEFFHRDWQRGTGGS